MKKIILLGLCMLGFGKAVYAQNYILISEDGIRKFMRVDFGYTQWTIQPMDSPARVARGLHLLNEVKILSGLNFFADMDNYVAVHDAFYFDLDMGWMASKPRVKQEFGQTETETHFSFTSNFGFLEMAGYRNNRWGLLAGLDFRWHMARTGDFAMPYLDGPLLYHNNCLVGRGELAFTSTPSQRIVLMGWTSLNNTLSSYQSLRLEIPLGAEARWWVMAQYIHQTALASDNFLFTPDRMARFDQFRVGFRIGGLP